MKTTIERKGSTLKQRNLRRAEAKAKHEKWTAFVAKELGRGTSVERIERGLVERGAPRDKVRTLVRARAKKEWNPSQKKLVAFYGVITLFVAGALLAIVAL